MSLSIFFKSVNLIIIDLNSPIINQSEITQTTSLIFDFKSRRTMKEIDRIRKKPRFIKLSSFLTLLHLEHSYLGSLHIKQKAITKRLFRLSNGFIDINPNDFLKIGHDNNDASFMIILRLVKVVRSVTLAGLKGNLVEICCKILLI